MIYLRSFELAGERAETEIRGVGVEGIESKSFPVPLLFHGHVDDGAPSG